MDERKDLPDGGTKLLPAGRGRHPLFKELVVLAVLVASSLGVILANEFLPLGGGPGTGTPSANASEFSSSTPKRVIDSLTLEEAIPAEGKFIGADLEAMKLYLYEDGKQVKSFDILTKGRPGTAFETPSGFYEVLTKERNHLSTIGDVYMPYSMQFYGNYFIHGWPYYPDGTPVATSYSGGCIRLSTEDAGEVFAFADLHTKLFVREATEAASTTPLALTRLPAPAVSAAAYLVADIDTGDVYLEKNATEPLPIASVTKLMTALVANETISYERHITVTKGNLRYPQDPNETGPDSVVVGELFYPLLMESNNAVADTLAAAYGTKRFVAWMNSTAQSLGMKATTYADASGANPGNISTADDLYRLALYLTTRKPFVFKISRAPTHTLTTDSGGEYRIRNFNLFADDPSFLGGKVGQTSAAGETMVSTFAVTRAGETHRVAIVVLRSKDNGTDTRLLHDWLVRSVAAGSPACATCADTETHRKIGL